MERASVETAPEPNGSLFLACHSLFELLVPINIITTADHQETSD